MKSPAQTIAERIGNLANALRFALITLEGIKESGEVNTAAIDGTIGRTRTALFANQEDFDKLIEHLDNMEDVSEGAKDIRELISLYTDEQLPEQPYGHDCDTEPCQPTCDQLVEMLNFNRTLKRLDIRLDRLKATSKKVTGTV